MVELTFSDKLLMFKKHYDDIMLKNKARFRIRDRACKKEELADAVPVNIKVFFDFFFSSSRSVLIWNLFMHILVPDQY